MLKSKEGEDIGAGILNGDVYDTRNIWYSQIEEIIESAQDEPEIAPLNQKALSKGSFLKMKYLLDKGTELRNRFTGENLNKIPFDFFVENGNDAYFVEVKTKTKSDSAYFVYSNTEWIGLAVAKKYKIPVYIIWLHAQETDLKKYVPEFELLEIKSYRLPIPTKNITTNKRMLNTNPFEFDSCNEDTSEKVIRKEFLDLIIR